MRHPNNQLRQFLVFQTSGLDCAFPLEDIREIVPMAKLSAPPGLAEGLAGFLDLRGTAVPIIRLDKMFDLPEQKPGLYTPMIILRGAPRAAGILVNSVRGIVPAASARPVDLPQDQTFRGCASATLELDGDLIHLLSPAALLDVNENRLLSDYSVMAQARLRHMKETGEPHYARPVL